MSEVTWNDLEICWRRALLDAGVSQTDAVQSVFDKIMGAYTQTHRDYHNGYHLWEMITALNEYGDATSKVSPLVYIAAFFHDFVCIPGYATNEKESATYAKRLLIDELKYDPGLSNMVGAMIEHTETYGRRFSHKTFRVLYDADFVVLGSSPERYAEYSQQVRAEYRTVKNAAYKKARIEVLNKLLALDPIFITPWFREKYEQQARANIDSEIRRLENT